MCVSADALLGEWRELRTAQSGRMFTSRRLDSQSLGLGVHAAIRFKDSAPCLLFDLPNPLLVRDDFDTASLRTYRVSHGGSVLLVLALEEPSQVELFARVCADIVAFAGQEAGDTALKLVVARLAAWCSFLRSGDSLGVRELVGVAGELAVLRELCAVDGRAVDFWESPSDGLWDFRRGSVAMEAKATLGLGGRVHVSTLDQLDNSSLQGLFLCYVRFVESEDGLSLPELIGRVEEQLRPDQKRVFSNALLRRGLLPGERWEDGSLKLSAQELRAWRIVGDFPRLTRASVPLGVSDATYELDTSQLRSYAIDFKEAVADFWKP
ncbi:PD-(D/E)XK motif protein [Lysobacter humi (ex Lee et al. 2017)]